MFPSKGTFDNNRPLPKEESSPPSQSSFISRDYSAQYEQVPLHRLKDHDYSYSPIQIPVSNLPILETSHLFSTELNNAISNWNIVELTRDDILQQNSTFVNNTLYQPLSGPLFLYKKPSKLTAQTALVSRRYNQSWAVYPSLTSSLSFRALLGAHSTLDLLHPKESVITNLGLRPDFHFRSWLTAEDPRFVFYSYGDFLANDSVGYEHITGSKSLAKSTVLDRFIAEVEATLIPSPDALIASIEAGLSEDSHRQLSYGYQRLKFSQFYPEHSKTISVNTVPIISMPKKVFTKKIDAEFAKLSQKEKLKRIAEESSEYLRRNFYFRNPRALVYNIHIARSRKLVSSVTKNTRASTSVVKKTGKGMKKRTVEDEEEEARRQQNRLNFLLKQTEIYRHFMAKKISKDQMDNLMKGDDAEAAKAAKLAADRDQAKLGKYGDNNKFNEQAVNAPKLLHGVLKPYQLAGLNWLVSLYEQGINGVLSDDMGLGKTVQSISFLLYLVETHKHWGPFLIVTPNSTLKNWINELERFAPDLNSRPLWGSVQDRKKILKAWERNPWGEKNAHVHVVVTSYQIAVQDEKLLKQIPWHFMVLDEGQNVKGFATQRTQSLLSYPCRNRLLLSGTPLQNTLQELWTLLHFVMPSLFDSMADFQTWFAKDIDGTKNMTGAIKLDKKQLERLQSIIKPFMLRRVKSDVEKDMAPKTEIVVFCPMTIKQRQLSTRLKALITNRSSIANDFDEDVRVVSTQGDQALANLIVHFRKICNHPDLFEPRFNKAPFAKSYASPFTVTGASHHIDNVPSIAQIETKVIPVDNQRAKLIEEVVKMQNQVLQEYSTFEDTDATIETFVVERDNKIPININVPTHLIGNYIPKAVTTAPKLTSSNNDVGYPISHSMMKLMDFETLVHGSGKLKYLDSLLPTLQKEGHRCLIYSQMTKMMDILSYYLAFRGYKHVRFDGSFAAQQRAQLVDDFTNDSSIFCFLLSTRAGGLGINLTAADTVIFYDSDWNPTIDAQAQDRAHRLGQTKPVTVYRLVTKNSIESRVLELADRKSKIQDAVLGDGAGSDDIDSLFQSKEDAYSLFLDEDEMKALIEREKNEKESRRKASSIISKKAREKKVELVTE